MQQNSYIKVEAKSYKPPWYIRGRHLETVVPGLLRKVNHPATSSDRIPTPDSDFLELDWHQKSNKQLVIISHGLEGDNRRPYVLGMARAFNEASISALAWNYRGCGPTLNNKPRLYHSGATEDLDTVVNHAISKGYDQIILVGFSLGGNLTLKYIGERANNLNPVIKSAIAFSTPINLDAGCRQISQRSNRMYAFRFLRNLKTKVKLKHEQFPEIISMNGLAHVHDLRSFDDHYTGPIHGFADATEYYAKCSSKQFLEDVAIPTLIINAQNDPFLPSECYLQAGEIENANIVFETPTYGGHVGFFLPGKTYWSERRAVQFVLANLTD